jgi:Na+-transporting NADH:ubiquinone oxidoreductase subunit NqrC
MFIYVILGLIVIISILLTGAAIIIKETHVRARSNFKKIMVVRKYGSDRTGTEEDAFVEVMAMQEELEMIDIADHAFVALLKDVKDE